MDNPNFNQNDMGSPILEQVREGMRVVDPLSAASGDEQDRLIRDRLMREGFIKVDPDLFASDVYVLPGQIESVSNDEVHLRVPKDDLIRR